MSLARIFLQMDVLSWMIRDDVRDDGHDDDRDVGHGRDLQFR